MSDNRFPGDGNGYAVTAEPGDHPHYALVLKMVLWGEEADQVYRRLAVNGVSGEVARRLYEHARRDRIRTIRGHYRGKMWVGAGLVLAAMGMFFFCWYGLGFISRLLIYVCAAGLGVGGWKFIDGLSGYLMAPMKTGSVADDM
jgi:hypothetical protein